MHAELPADITINKEAGRGGWLVVMLRVERGQEMPFLVDTGSPVTILDTSLEPKLGERHASLTLWSQVAGKQNSGVYKAPKLSVGTVPLMTESYVVTCNFNKVSARSHQRIMGVIGYDVLRHYCIQLDFQARKMRFLNSPDLRIADLGKAFPLLLSNRGQNFPPIFAEAGQNEDLPFIHHPGLAGGSSQDLLIDTGDNVDGAVEKEAIKGHYLTRFAHLFMKFRAVRLRKCVWDDETYTNLRVGTGTNRLGIRFLARHLVTFDFPKQTMYLKPESAGPLRISGKK